MLRSFEVNCGCLTSNSWKAFTIIEGNCGGVTSNSWKTLELRLTVALPQTHGKPLLQ